MEMVSLVNCLIFTNHHENVCSQKEKTLVTYIETEETPESISVEMLFYFSTVLKGMGSGGHVGRELLACNPGRRKVNRISRIVASLQPF